MIAQSKEKNRRRIAKREKERREGGNKKSQFCACSEYMLMFEHNSCELLTHTIHGYSGAVSVMLDRGSFRIF